MLWKKNKKDWQLISDEATVYGSTEISTKLSYSSKVEEMGVWLGEVARNDSTVRQTSKWDSGNSGIDAYKGKEVQKQLSWSA